MLFHILLLAFYFCSVDSVSNDYCQPPLNQSNCGESPVPVFTYHKPSSTCMVALWMGCPTKNRFDNEHKCVSTCMGSNAGVAVPKAEVEHKNRCNEPLNTNPCKKEITLVYTYNKEKRKCVEALWYGCSTFNKFDDKLSCMEACHNDSNFDWKDKLRSLDLNSIKGLHTVLEEVIKSNELTAEENNKEFAENKRSEDDNDRVNEYKANQRAFKNVIEEPEEDINIADKEKVREVVNKVD